MRNIILFMFFICLGACSHDTDMLTPIDGISSCVGDDIYLKDGSGNNVRPFMINDSTMHFSCSEHIDLSHIKVYNSNTIANLIYNGDTISEGQEVDLSDFTIQLRCDYINDRNDTLKKSIIIYDLPILTINTPNEVPIDSKKERVQDCDVNLISNGENIKLGKAGIRGRGNSTWLQQKKPYNIKFERKVGILGMPKSKHWILLANAFYDRTQIHNSTAFEIARMTDFPWVQSGSFVEVIINGKHNGLYYLCEKIGAEGNKLLPESDNSTPIKECNYLLESYVYVKEGNIFPDTNAPSGTIFSGFFNETGKSTTPCYYGWEIKSPEHWLSEPHINYINSYVQKVEELIHDSIETWTYRDFFDIESAINWWLVEELCLNEEASRTKNVYLYKVGGGKLAVGPPWDFDAWSFGQIGIKNRSWNLDDALYFEKLFEDPTFVKRLKEKWSKYYPVWKTEIPMFIEKQYKIIHKAAERNEFMWTQWHPINYYGEKSYRQCILEMKEMFVEQLEIMNSKITAL